MENPLQKIPWNPLRFCPHHLWPNSSISAQLLVCSLTAKWESWLARARASKACSWLDNAKLPKPRFMERFGVFLILCDFCWSISPGSKSAELLWSRDNWGSAIATFSLPVCCRSSCVLVLTWCSLLSALADPDFDYRHRNTSTLSDRVLVNRRQPPTPTALINHSSSTSSQFFLAPEKLLYCTWNIGA
jgi:hypothetical protein